jgi:hypothetical protein
MTGKDLERPREGARLDHRLVVRATCHMFVCFIRYAPPMEVKLANDGGAIPFLLARPGQPIPRIKFLDANRGAWTEPTFERYLGYVKYVLTSIRKKVDTT